MTKSKTRAERAGELPGRMPHVPVAVVKQMQDHLRERDFSQRGMPAVLEHFFSELETAGLPPERVTEDIFRAVGTSRSRFRCLIDALRQFAPDVPLSPSVAVKARWDQWLNSTYNKKPKVEKISRRVGLAPEDWPEKWRKGLAALDRSVRPYGTRLKPFLTKSKSRVMTSVGHLAQARVWAARRGVELPDEPASELFEGFLHYLDEERDVSFGTARDYIESAKMFFLRAGLFDDDGYDAACSLISALHAEAQATDPNKWSRLREFRRDFTLTDVLQMAVSASRNAVDRPGHSYGAFQLRQKAMIYALLVNTGDRQGDLREYRIGIDLVRDHEFGWCHGIRQGKTGNKKELDALWPGTSDLIDRHILGDRPTWTLEERLAEVEGLNLLSLSDQVMNPGYVNRRLHEDFGLHGHLVRTLIADLLRKTHPDALWVLQHMLGHTNRTTQRVYRSDFDESAAVRAMDGLVGALGG